jgi:2-polyprenyl-6-methoxyphenol hydroxylase-like FAD-dependent oxidoreductase
MDDALIVGAGPVGLTLAGELCRHGVRCRLVDRLSQPLPYCRAIGVTPRTLEVWEDMGVARDMIDAGLLLVGGRSVIDGRPPHDVFELYPDLPYGPLGLPQYETERVLAQHLRQFGVEVERGVAVSAMTQTADAVSVQFLRADGSVDSASARYVVGCDGAHSAVRHALGIGFVGNALPMSFMLGDLHIDWDLARGMTFRALNLVEGGAPDIFIAIPLPDAGRYRVSAIANPSALPTKDGNDHGIQSESRGPALADLQAVADRLVPGKPRLSDMRWSSNFRISMRLAETYRQGRVFIAGDAAHIHPPTGGQGMNTGVQDAHNLAWKLALVLRGESPEALLDSYDAERWPVGAEVVARTSAATRNYGREPVSKPDRLADTQIRVNYRGTDWVRDDVEGLAATIPMAGDRAPDAAGLVRLGVGFPLRLVDILRGTPHTLLIHLANTPATMTGLASLAEEMRARFGFRVRIVVVSSSDSLPDQPGVALLHDRQGSFRNSYGDEDASFLVRPDGYIGWRGRCWRNPGLFAHLDRMFEPRLPRASVDGHHGDVV